MRYIGTMSNTTSGKQRLDQALVDLGHAPTRSQARDLIKRGCVTVEGLEAAKPGQLVTASAGIEVMAGAQPYVSRGGLKLAAALDRFEFPSNGRIALDIGASTGGFTQVLLQRGAAKVFAVDIGQGQLHATVAADPRVISLEGVDARSLDAGLITPPPAAIAADVSFVSLRKVLAPAMSLAAGDAWLVALVKPQFEAGREAIGKGGIVRDEAERDRALLEVSDWIAGQSGWRVVGTMPSPIAGGSGNIEMLIGARRDG